MTNQGFERKLRKIKEQKGVEIDLRPIDKDHLDPVWYGGRVGYIKFSDGWTVVVEAIGDIRLHGFVNGEEIDVVDKNNGGRVYDELGDVLNDASLDRLLVSEDNGGDFLEYGNNNWFEFDVVSPDGQFIDCFNCDNVLDDNLLSCFEDAGEYSKIVEWAKSELREGA